MSKETALAIDFRALIEVAPFDGLEEVRQRILGKLDADQIGSAEASRLLALIYARRTRGE
jgi:hypothetical protein